MTRGDENDVSNRMKWYLNVLNQDEVQRFFFTGLQNEKFEVFNNVQSFSR